MRMHTHARLSKKRFEQPGERRRWEQGGGGGRMSAWSSRLLSGEQPAALPRRGQQGALGRRPGSSDGEHRSACDAEVEMTELHRAPRSQEDWVQWAMPRRGDGNLNLAPWEGGAEDGGARAYGTFGKVGDDEGDEFDDEDDVDDEGGERGEGGEDEGAYEEYDEDEEEAKMSDYLFLHHARLDQRGNGVSLLGGEP